ncbi:MAG: HNH endonuclease [Bacteroidaceae bacterium]|nr:HNH endonuclease [Bacteroidaceae bacterium]
MIDVNENYTREVECEYKEERYKVRDNGAIFRMAREGKPKRAKDEVWTFGEKIDRGYARFCNEAVHRIVAVAFHGEPPTNQHVVDHIDTNRQNNRPENLRWLTKLENILLNPFTKAKIEFWCGSVERFLQDPSLLKGHESLDPNFAWMRAVTSEEAKNTHWQTGKKS